MPQLRRLVDRNRSISSLGKRQGRLLILGSGWAGFKFLNTINDSEYDVALLSPRNYHVFTPMLASSAVGTTEFRSIISPVRSYKQAVEYHQAYADKIDWENRNVIAHSTLNGDNRQISISFDKLIIGVGANAATFNTPGVGEYALFLRDVSDARRIRTRVLDCFEAASQPGVSQEEQLAKLHFVIVGGGPTGIEFASELYDLCVEDLKRLYPALINLVRITIYDVAPTILGAFDQKLVDYTVAQFQREGIQIKTGRRVEKITKTHVTVKDGTTGASKDVPYGVLVWSTGLAPNPFVRALSGSVMLDESSRGIVTDSKLRVLDPKGTVIPDVYALGDCATIQKSKLPALAQVANQQAKHLAKELNKISRRPDRYTSDDISDFKWRNLG